jgi:hypothetical protein
MDGGGGGDDGRWQVLQWETATAVAAQWMVGGSGVITMRGIEIAVNGGGVNWQRRHNGWQDCRTAATGQEDGVVNVLNVNERDSPHTTGIHKIVVNKKKCKNVEKKRVEHFSTYFCRFGGLLKVEYFFQLWNKRAIPK